MCSCIWCILEQVEQLSGLVQLSPVCSSGLVCDSLSLTLLVLLVLLKVKSLPWAEGVPQLNRPKQIKQFERNGLLIAVSTHSSRRAAGSPNNIHGSCEGEVIPALH